MPAPRLPLTMLLRAALLACLLAVVPAAAASAAAPGLNLGGPLPQAELDNALSGGAKTVRYFASWPDLQPSGPGAWNTGLLAAYEANVAHLGQRGVRAVIVLNGAPA